MGTFLQPIEPAGRDTMVKFFPSLFLALASTVAIAAAQTRTLTGKKKADGTFTKKLPVKLGSDGRPLLFAPKLEACQNRISHGKLGDHHYFLSWREPCMDLISFDTAHEFKMFQEVMAADNISSI